VNNGEGFAADACPLAATKVDAFASIYGHHRRQRAPTLLPDIAQEPAGRTHFCLINSGPRVAVCVDRTQSWL
jgi:hypothetical protein